MVRQTGTVELVFTCITCGRRTPLDDALLRSRRTSRCWCLRCYAQSETDGGHVRTALVQQFIDALEAS